MYLYLFIFKHFAFPVPGNEKGEKVMNYNMHYD